MNSIQEHQTRIRDASIGLGLFFGLFLKLSAQGLHTALNVVISPDERMKHVLGISLLWFAMAFSILGLLGSMLESSIQFATGGSYESSALHELLLFVEHRFAAGALIMFSLAWAVSDFIFYGVHLQAAHCLIVVKLGVAAWCLRKPMNLQPVLDTKVYQSASEEDGGVYIPLI
jgi:hypothetical protein